MPGVFSVFNIGTGHTAKEINNTMASLGRECLNQLESKTNDGPMGLLGKTRGWGMDKKCDDTVKAILARKASAVNLAGHSRGGVLCYMIANGLAAKGFAGKVNMVVLDPVNMSIHVQKATELRQGINLGNHVAIVMENVTNVMFPLTEVKPLDVQFRTHMCTYSMPGTHGSGTQFMTSAVGEATKGMIKYFMQLWGTRFSTLAPNPGDLLELFAGIHAENPVHYDAKGLVKDRFVFDDTKGMNNRKDFEGGFQNVGRHEQIGALLKGGTRPAKTRETRDYRDSPYFFNAFHADCFRRSFPEVYRRFVGGEYYWKHVASTAAHQRTVREEMTEMKGFPTLWKSLVALGMLD